MIKQLITHFKGVIIFGNYEKNKLNERGWKMSTIMNGKMLWIRRIFFICYDVLAVLIASFLALLVRFDFHISLIPVKYYELAWGILPIEVLVTLAVF